MDSSRIGRYIVEKEIGKGGMGTVYAAQDPYMKRRVAIKMMARDLSEDPFFRARFQAEAQVIAGLEHAYVVPVYDFGEHDGQQYIVMRYMPNNSLSYWLKDGSLPLSDCVMVLERMAEALDEAHSRDLVHRDFKPANILFDRQGGAYLADFGLVKIIADNSALSGPRSGGHHWLHVARADPGRGVGRRAGGRVCDGRHAVRDADRAASLPRRGEHQGDDGARLRAGAQRADAQARPRPARRRDHHAGDGQGPERTLQSGDRPGRRADGHQPDDPHAGGRAAVGRPTT